MHVPHSRMDVRKFKHDNLRIAAQIYKLHNSQIIFTLACLACINYIYLKKKKELDMNKFDKHLISKYILNIFLYIKI